jgi:GTP cyclohydrolase III
MAAWSFRKKSIKTMHRNLSEYVMKVPGVAGFGINGNKLAVYLETDNQDTKDKVAEIMSQARCDIKVVYIVAGKFYACGEEQ